jgi:hypothetical protein
MPQSPLNTFAVDGFSPAKTRALRSNQEDPARAVYVEQLDEQRRTPAGLSIQQARQELEGAVHKALGRYARSYHQSILAALCSAPRFYRLSRAERLSLTAAVHRELGCCSVPPVPVPDWVRSGAEETRKDRVTQRRKQQK